MTAPAESERTRRRRQAQERAERALAAWQWAGDRWPLWAFAGSLAVPEGGTKRKVARMDINAPLAEPGGDVLLFGRMAP
jgi:hypothetical protein